MRLLNMRLTIRKDLGLVREKANKFKDLVEDLEEIVKKNPMPELTDEMAKAKGASDALKTKIGNLVKSDLNLQNAILNLDRANRQAFEALIQKPNLSAQEIEDFFKPKEGAKIGLTPDKMEYLRKLAAFGLFALLVDTVSAQTAAEKDMKAKTGKNSLPTAGAKTKSPASEAVVDEGRDSGSH